jgi:hypothetical protein
MNSRLDFREHEIISVFKTLDVNHDGTVSRREVVEGFRQVGIDAKNEIEVIMGNLDIDGSGKLDFTEIKIALVDWGRELNRENLGRTFRNEQGKVELAELKQLFPEVLPHEWNEFVRRTKAETGTVELEALAEFLKEEVCRE